MFEKCQNAQTADFFLPLRVDFPCRATARLCQIALIDEKISRRCAFRHLSNNPNQMSDGERAVLYLAAQVLCVPENKTLIIDEPELHLHRSIMNRLWVALENHRPDCLFIYITHDTQFAAMHGHADKIWIKEFDGQNWKFDKLENRGCLKNKEG